MAATQRPLASTESRAAAERFYLPELDALRFFAFLAVFVAHINLGLAGSRYQFPGRIAEMGAFGVDLFFALSAYLLCTLLLREREQTGTVDAWAFYMRRSLRIWPLYFTFLALLFVMNGPLRLGVPDIYFAMFGSLLFGTFAMYVSAGGPAFYGIGVFWSLAVEEQFYAVWPWIGRALSRRGIAVFGCSIWCTSVLARIWLFVPNHAGGLWFLSLTRLDPIACGILIACAPRIKVNRRSALLLGATCWIAAAAMVPGDQYATMLDVGLGYPLVAIGAGAFLLAALGCEARMLRSRATVYLGRISYGLYVFHATAIYLLARLVPALLLPPLAMLLTIGIASASYRWLESPFLRLKRHFARV